MRINANHIEEANSKHLAEHNSDFAYLSDKLSAKGLDVVNIIEKIKKLQIAIPSFL